MQMTGFKLPVLLVTAIYALTMVGSGVQDHSTRKASENRTYELCVDIDKEEILRKHNEYMEEMMEAVAGGNIDYRMKNGETREFTTRDGTTIMYG